MILIFYGMHSPDWMKVLNKNLKDSLNQHFTNKKLKNVDEIINIFDLDELKKFISSKDFYIIIPLMESHIEELRNANILNVKAPSLEITKIFSNKKLFNDYLIKEGLTDFSPATYTSLENLPKSGFFMMKPHCSSNGYGISLKESVIESDFNDNIVQECIPNYDEYVSHIVAVDGKIKECITYKYSFRNKFHIKKHPRNTFNISKIYLDKIYIYIMELFLKGYSGPCNFDFVIDNTRIKIFEINPRLGGSLIRKNNEDLHSIIEALIFK